MATILVTGSNRGLGLEWVRRYAADGWRVYATCRHPQQADELQRLAHRHANVTIHRLDVTAADQIAALAAELRDRPIDLLVNKAGGYFEQWDRDPFGSVDVDAWEQALRCNTLGAVRVTEALADQAACSERRLILVITSHMGSIADIGSPRSYAYRSSKAALNAAMKGIALELRPRGIGLLLLHPGWVSTRMGGDAAPYAPQQSVSGMRQLADHFRMEQSGRFYRFDGVELPW